MKKFYAAKHSHSIDFTYDSYGWTFYSFTSKKSRDDFVKMENDKDAESGNKRTTDISVKDLRKYLGRTLQEEETGTINDTPVCILSYNSTTPTIIL